MLVGSYPYFSLLFISPVLGFFFFPRLNLNQERLVGTGNVFFMSVDIAVKKQASSWITLL